MEMEKLNKIVAAIIFAFTAVVYTMTVAPTVSFWDCGEFIASSYKMAVPHPPGAPLYLLVGRLFSLLPIASDIALRVNMISVISSALTIMLLYLTIVHLVRQYKGNLVDKSEWFTAIFSGVIGSLSFAFSHSFWFNSAEAEVYAPSMFFTALIVWLILVWAQKSEEPGSDRYLIMIVYSIGLSIGVHLLNILALPFVAMVYYYKRYEFNIKSFAIMTATTAVVMLAVYPGMVKYVPVFALDFGATGLALLFIIIIGATVWAVKNHKHLLSFIFLSVFLISIGYSTYATIFIRSNLNPNIDENNPETVENFIKYINREQYGDHSITDRSGVWKTSPNGKDYSSVSDFFFNYQINKMYVRYFLWQFVGMDPDEYHVSYQFLAIPLLLGLIGLVWHFWRDPKYALAVMALFLMTGLAIIIYLNQPDPQPRERDYSYVGSFFAFAIWIGLGYAGLVDLIKYNLSKKGEELKTFTLYMLFVVLLIGSPIQMLAKSFHSHDRSGNTVAWDYSYNMLISCEPNAILFTNGDNDTFPLWYLQEVENIRTDVRIVNLSLLNTDWYIKQLKDLEPKVPMAINDLELDRLGLIPWKTQKVTVEVPKKVAEESQREFAARYSYQNIDVPDKITFEVRPALNTRVGGVLRTQDYMILNILTANRWKRPIYFAVTVPRSNMVSELADYMRMDGLVMKIVPYKNWRISPDDLGENMIEKYQYRGLDNPKVYYNDNIQNLLQNYRSGFIQLAEYYAREGEYKDVKRVLQDMDKKIDPNVIRFTSSGLKAIRDAFYIVADSTMEDSLLSDINNVGDIEVMSEQLLRMRQLKPAIRILEGALNQNGQNARILSMLINAYQMTNQPEKAIAPLEDWLKQNPDDKNAERALESIKQRMTNKN
jgi:hypothetical protein